MELFTNIGAELWNTLCEMAPYLLFGFVVAGLLAVLVPADTVEKHLGGRGLWPVIKAASFGVPLPLCSCGVIPVAASLRKHGASRGATIAFLLSTPQTGVDSIMVTYGLLGPVFAVFRPIAALVTGVLAGAIVEFADGKTVEHESAVPACTDECCAPTHKRPWFIRTLHYGLVSLPRDIARPMLLGLLVAGVISALVPADFFSAIIGTGIGAMFVMMLVGIPLYVCATASVPIAAAMIAKGISPGAALVFLMTGPATNAAAIATIWKVMGKRTTFIYLGVLAVSALCLGMLLDWLFTVSAVHGHMAHTMLPHSVNVMSAIALLAVLGAAIVGPHRRHEHGHVHKTEAGETVTNITIDGMTCSHCAHVIQRAVSECDGVTSVEVSLETGKAVVRGSDCDVDSMRNAVESLGYKVRNIGSG